MKISIVTAVRNNKKCLKSCIESVASQAYRTVDHIVIDGCSTDGTLDVIRSYSAKISKWISEPDNGIYDALNKGIKMATGGIIGFLHADDIYASDRILETVVKEMTTHNVDSCYGDLQYVDIDDTSKVVRNWKSCPYQNGLFVKGWMLPHPTFFVRREIYEKYGCFDTGFRIAADYELMLRFLHKHRISTHYISEVLVKMRVGGASNKSLRNIIQKSAEDYRAMRIHNIGGVKTLFRKNVSKITQFF